MWVSVGGVGRGISIACDLRSRSITTHIIIVLVIQSTLRNTDVPLKLTVRFVVSR